MGKEKPKVRRAMESRGERRRMENGRPQVTNGRPEVRRAMENGGERKAMEDDGYETMWELDEDEPIHTKEMVMCSTCAGFVMRKKCTSLFYIGKDVVDVAEVVKEAEKMRDLMRAVLLHGPFQEKEPAEATKEQWWILRRKRRVMMETKRCPACSRSLLDRCPTCSHSLSEKPGPDEEGKAAGSKEKKKKNSWEEGSAVLPSQGGEEGKKIAREDEAMVANAGSVNKSKQSREEGNGSSSGLKKKKAKSEDKEGSGSKKKAKRSSEMEGSGPKETETEGSGSKEVKMKVRKSAGGNGKTKMVTRRLDKMSIDIIVKYSPPVKPYTFRTPDTFMERKFASQMAQYELHCEFHEYLRCQSIIRGYAEYQEEVTDDEDE